ncbi:MAG: Outer membrane protein assembly factor BamB [Burkholderiaceae bacterium]|nr:Outer membrane protein assembly factor BamB [Burkholderiaceae bacterium]
MRLFARALWLALPLLLTACASEKPKPTPLQPIELRLQGRVLWSSHLARVPFALAVQARDGVFVAAGGDGSVVALDAATGAERWRASAGSALTAAVGSDGRFAAVVTRNNELVVFERGAERWRKALTSRVSTAPLVAGERVFVLGVDRAVDAFDALDGRPLWRLQRPTDPLTLAQPGVLAPYQNTLLVGQGARLLGVDSLHGTVRWEVALANPRGTNEIERLADLVGPPVRLGDVLCARAFQWAVACARLDNATLRWSRHAGGIEPVGGDSELVVGADASDRITAWKTATGDIAWTQEKLLYRGLSGPLVTDAAVLVGDSEGYVHALARDDGRLLARWSTDGSPVMAPPVKLGDTVLVVTRNGGLYAMRVG